MIMMTYNPKYYLDFAEKYGFKKAKDLYTFYRYAKDGIPERILKLAERIKKRGNIKIRYLNMKNLMRN